MVVKSKRAVGYDKLLQALVPSGQEQFEKTRLRRLPSLLRDGSSLWMTLLLTLFLIGGVNAVFGQATSGSISGFVTDSSGAAVPNAKVTVSNEATGIATEATTDKSGFYNVTHIIAGSTASR